MKHLLFVALSVFIFTACTSSTNTDPLNQNTSLNTGITYTLTFSSTWSETSHPQDFPQNPHFSGLIGTTHDATTTLWESEKLASSGIESMAETGSKEALLDIIQELINTRKAQVTISGDGMPVSPGSSSVSFSISDTYPYVSVVSMLAPSPDWFVGVSGVLLKEENTWVEEKTVSLYLYDAGTDDGETYNSNNADTSPKESIRLLTSTSGPFTNGEPAIGTFTFKKVIQ